MSFILLDQQICSTPENLSNEERLHARNQQKTIIDEIETLILETLKLCPKVEVTICNYQSYKTICNLSNSWADALCYFLHNVKELRTFLKSLDVCVSNNQTEGLAIRPFCVLRKNCMFTNSIDGAMALCDMLTVAATCIQNNVDFGSYLSWLFQNMKMRIEEDRLLAGIPRQTCLQLNRLEPLDDKNIGPDEKTDLARVEEEYQCREYLALANIYRPDRKGKMDDLQYKDLTVESFVRLYNMETERARKDG